MEFPFGHHSHTHTHHHRREDDEDQEERRSNYDFPPPGSRPRSFDPPPPPPPYSFYGQDEPAPPPPPPQFYHSSEYSAPPPRRPVDYDSHDYPSRPAAVQHVSHVSEETETETHHSYRPHLPSFLHHHTSETSSGLANKPTYKVYSKADPSFYLAIREGQVILAPADADDASQHWYKDEKYSTRVKDEEGFPCFSLVNKATGQAVKHSTGESDPVQLVPYNPDALDQSVLWTLSKDFGDGFRTIRMVKNIRLNVDAFHGDKKSGGVRDGTTIVLWKWNRGDNQLWKIAPYCKCCIHKILDITNR